MIKTGETIEIDGVKLIGGEGIGERREDFDTYLLHVNGCGAGNASFDFVPDTIYGLRVTPICNLHDDAWTFCENSREAFDYTNQCFKKNLNAWIKAKAKWYLVLPSLVRAHTYYKAVQRLGWSAFQSCHDRGKD